MSKTFNILYTFDDITESKIIDSFCSFEDDECMREFNRRTKELRESGTKCEHEVNTSYVNGIIGATEWVDLDLLQTDEYEYDSGDDEDFEDHCSVCGEGFHDGDINLFVGEDGEFICSSCDEDN